MSLEKKSAKRVVWEDPELVVLIRNKPEEAVLEACKSDSGLNGQSPSMTFYQCQVDPWSLGAGCGAGCSVLTSS